MFKSSNPIIQARTGHKKSPWVHNCPQGFTPAAGVYRPGCAKNMSYGRLFIFLMQKYLAFGNTPNEIK